MLWEAYSAFGYRLDWLHISVEKADWRNLSFDSINNEVADLEDCFTSVSFSFLAFLKGSKN